jgi:hypothetical protein
MIKTTTYHYYSIAIVNASALSHSNKGSFPVFECGSGSEGLQSSDNRDIWLLFPFPDLSPVCSSHISKEQGILLHGLLIRFGESQYHKGCRSPSRSIAARSHLTYCSVMKFEVSVSRSKCQNGRQLWETSMSTDEWSLK